MLRNVLAGIAGVLVAGGLIVIVEMAGHSMYPPPPDLDFTDMDAMRAYVSTLPVGAFLFVACAWGIGSLGGTFAAAKIGNASALIYACIVGGLILAGIAYNLSIIPHPLWVAVAGIGLTISGAWLGMSLAGSATESTK